MAKQIAGLCRFEGTFDDLTFYKMDGQYYVRVKSSLTSERVKTSPEFKWTMVYARLLARASKIGSQVYKALPPGWRQFWMYRSFTGEAFTLLKKNPYTDEQVKQILWKCYVEYWEQIKAAALASPSEGELVPPQREGRGEAIWQPKPAKKRKRRVYTLEALMRKRDKYGRPKYPQLIKAEKERIEREAKEAWIKKLEEKKQKAALAQNLPAINQAIRPEEPETNQVIITPKQPAIHSPWQVTADGNLYTEGSPPYLQSPPQPAIHLAAAHRELTAKT